jgi:hypothetical protein
LSDALARRVDELLLRARSVETLRSAYGAWDELRAAHREAVGQLAAEGRRLDEQAAFLVGAVRAAAGQREAAPGASDLPASQTQGFLSSAEAKLKAAKEELLNAQAAESTRYAKARELLVDFVLARVQRPEGPTPQVCMRLCPLPQGRAILHVDRLRDDAPVTLLHLLVGLLPTHYGYLDDDSTDDVNAGATLFYPEEGVQNEWLRPTAPALKEALGAAKRVLPLKACLPFFTGEGQDRRLWRMLPRGPVLELDVEDGHGFRNILSRPEAEEAAGALVRLRLSGRIALEVDAT